MGSECPCLQSAETEDQECKAEPCRRKNQNREQHQTGEGERRSWSVFPGIECETRVEGVPRVDPVCHERVGERRVQSRIQASAHHPFLVILLIRRQWRAV